MCRCIYNYSRKRLEFQVKAIGFAGTPYDQVPIIEALK